MTEINPNNYPGAAVTLVGWAAGDPEYPAYDKEGKRGYKQISVAVTEGYKPKDGDFVKTGTTWYSISRKESDWYELGVGKGDKIRIDGAKQEVREYKNGKGEEKLGINLSFGEITVLESKNGGAAPTDDDDDDAPF